MSRAVRTESVKVWGDRLELEFEIAGEGPSLVYLHPASGLDWDPFVAKLAENRTVLAPRFPGTSPSHRQGIHAVDDLWDVVLAYEEGVRALRLGGAELVGVSFGGMLAAEIAAAFPSLFSKLVLVDALGLWRDDAPVWNWMTASPAALPARLFHDPTGPAARAALAPPADSDQAVAAQAAFVWALGCTGKFLWPIPEKGLHKRIHRIATPALIVWGAEDRLVPALYAEEFARRIQGSRVAMIAEAGHLPQLERAPQTWSAISSFLGIASREA